jgi:acetyl-CoA carboxylase biotin carboxyl carrier protein
MTSDDQVLETLDAARRGALRLLARLPEAPCALRVRAPGVDIEVDWATPATDGPRDQAEMDQAEVDRVGGSSPVVRSPTVGIFRTAEDGGEPFVAVGDAVERGQVVGVVSQLGLAIPVRADIAGTVVDAHRADGEPVEHDDALFVLDVG